MNLLSHADPSALIDIILIILVVSIQRIISSKIDKIVKVDEEITDIKSLIKRFGYDIKTVKSKIDDIEKDVVSMKEDFQYMKGVIDASAQ